MPVDYDIEGRAANIFGKSKILEMKMAGQSRELESQIPTW
jgi:hypothetical protein